MWCGSHVGKTKILDLCIFEIWHTASTPHGELDHEPDPVIFGHRYHPRGIMLIIIFWQVMHLYSQKLCDSIALVVAFCVLLAVS